MEFIALLFFMCSVDLEGAYSCETVASTSMYATIEDCEAEAYKRIKNLRIRFPETSAISKCINWGEPV